jgi:cyanophycin synthetase
MNEDFSMDLNLVGASAPRPSATAPQLVQLRLLRGCNVYHARSVFTARIDVGAWAGRHTTAFGPDFAEHFVERFDVPTRFIQSPALDPAVVHRLRSAEGAPIGAALLAAVRAVEAVALDATNLFDRVSFARSEDAGEGGEVRLIWETRAPELSKHAATLAVDGFAGLVEAAAPLAGGESFAAALEGLRERAGQRAISLSTAVVKQAAGERGLPHELVGDRLRIGQGARQQQFYASLIGGTSFVSTKLALDKRAAARRLKELALPVPAQLAVDSADAACAAAERLGLPVVVKPAKGNAGRGVTPGIRSVAEVGPAFERAERETSGVLVEAFVPGIEHRLLVVDRRFVAAARRVPPTATGDGDRSLRDLLAELNADPRRDTLRAMRIEIDDALLEMLARQGCDLDTVPERGRTIALRATSNVALGGVSIDVTDAVHPDNRRLAERAAEAVGLDIAGVDFITADITRSHHEVGGAIVEINSRPGLSVHALPFDGARRPVGAAVLDAAFPVGAVATVPTIVVAGERGTIAVGRQTERRLREHGTPTGLVLHDAAHAAGAPIQAEAGKMHRAIRTLLRDPTLGALVCATSLRGAVRRGLTLEHCDAAAVLRRQRGDEDAETFVAGVELLAAANRGAFVVRADDELTLATLAHLEPGRLILVAVTPDDERAARHVADGGTAVVKVWRDDGPHMTLLEGGEPLATAPVADEARGKQVQAPLFAWALAHAVGVRSARG